MRRPQTFLAIATAEAMFTAGLRACDVGECGEEDRGGSEEVEVGNVSYW